jgi:hypothetical protein
MMVWSLASSNARSEVMVRRGTSPRRKRAALRREAVLGVEANIVVCKLAHPKVVHADDLGLFGRAQTEEGDKVEYPEDGGLEARY